jgi:hypothetical protein
MGISMRLFEKYLKKKQLEHGSSGRAPAQQVQVLEFKL